MPDFGEACTKGKKTTKRHVNRGGKGPCLLQAASSRSGGWAKGLNLAGEGSKADGNTELSLGKTGGVFGEQAGGKEGIHPLPPGMIGIFVIFRS